MWQAHPRRGQQWLLDLVILVIGQTSLWRMSCLVEDLPLVKWSWMDILCLETEAIYFQHRASFIHLAEWAEMACAILIGESQPWMWGNQAFASLPASSRHGTVSLSFVFTSRGWAAETKALFCFSQALLIQRIQNLDMFGFFSVHFPDLVSPSHRESRAPDYLSPIAY